MKRELFLKAANKKLNPKTVDYVKNLPDASLHEGEFYKTTKSRLMGMVKAGLYRSNGKKWIRVE